jgi:hypothetical protein
MERTGFTKQKAGLHLDTTTFMSWSEAQRALRMLNEESIASAEEFKNCVFRWNELQHGIYTRVVFFYRAAFTVALNCHLFS